jgi:hypothetical protein
VHTAPFWSASEISNVQTHGWDAVDLLITADPLPLPPTHIHTHMHTHTHTRTHMYASFPQPPYRPFPPPSTHAPLLSSIQRSPWRKEAHPVVGAEVEPQQPRPRQKRKSKNLKKSQLGQKHR